MRALEKLQFDNSYARLPDSFYRRVSPTPFSEPAYLISFNADAARLIDLDPTESTRPEFVDYFSGRRLLPGADPIAMLYSGHQFGVNVSQLGDGRAILLGEAVNNQGEKWDLHLKGAGLTPFSRDGDGRAVLRSTIREYLCSEAMYGLGIPTTRALCIIGSDEKVWRESIETGAMLIRLAPTHVRFGSFEVFYYRRQMDHLKRLADYVIEQHFSELISSPNRYVEFFAEVVNRTSRLIAQWQAVGFAHGVMNTDNMSILGLTLDYGPFGFIDDYDPGFICNHSDHHGRYAFNQQPYIGLWNLSCLAQALLPLASEEPLKAALHTYNETLNAHYTELMCLKVGLQDRRDDDADLVTDLLTLMQNSRVDYTIFFRALSGFQTAPGAENHTLRDYCLDRAAFNSWARRYGERLKSERSQDAERRDRMNRVNPKYVLRNYLAQQAIALATEKKDYSEIDRLLTLLRDPFREQPTMESYAVPPPNWGKHISVSCSS
ncbi:MAG TPA: YdiU family protein [Nitrospiraceae bacterium]|nr:YdiU family protein [Nitrospiraceae bacterium]